MNTVRCGSDVATHLARVGERLRECRSHRDHHFANIEIICDDRKDYLHSDVAATFSAFIRKTMTALIPPFRIIMRGFHGHCVSNVIDWMYYGEVDVPVRFIAEHLAIAAALEIEVLHKQLEARLKQLSMEIDLMVPCLNIATDPRHQIGERTLRGLLRQFCKAHDAFSSTDLRQLNLNSILVLASSTDVSFVEKIDILNIILAWLKDDNRLRYVEAVLNALRIPVITQAERTALIERLRALFSQQNKQDIHVYTDDGRHVKVSIDPQKLERTSGVTIPGSADSLPEVEKGKRELTRSEAEEISRLPDITAEKRTPHAAHRKLKRLAANAVFQSPHPKSQKPINPRQFTPVPNLPGPVEPHNVMAPTEHGMGAINLQNIQSSIVNTPVKMVHGPGSVKETLDVGGQKYPINQPSNYDFHYFGINMSAQPHDMQIFAPQRAQSDVCLIETEHKKLKYSPSEIQEVNAHPEYVPSDVVIGKRNMTREELEDLRAIPPICGSKESIKLPIVNRYNFDEDEIEHINNLPDITGSQFLIGRRLRSQEELNEIKQLPGFEDKIIRNPVKEKSSESKMAQSTFQKTLALNRSPHDSHHFGTNMNPRPQEVVVSTPQGALSDVHLNGSDQEKLKYTPSEIYEVNAHPEYVPSDVVIGKRNMTREELEDLRAIPPICGSKESIKLPIVNRYDFDEDEIEHINNLPDITGSQFLIGRRLRSQEELNEIKQLPDFEDRTGNRSVGKSPEKTAKPPTTPGLIRSAYVMNGNLGATPQKNQKTGESQYELDKTPNKNKSAS